MHLDAEQDRATPSEPLLEDTSTPPTCDIEKEEIKGAGLRVASNPQSPASYATANGETGKVSSGATRVRRY